MRRFILYIIALAFISLAIANKDTLEPAVDPTGSVESPDSSEYSGFVPLDSLSLNTDWVNVNNDTAFFGYDSIFSTSDSIIHLNDSNMQETKEKDYWGRRANAIPNDTGRTRISRINREKVDLETSVSFDAKDSLVMIGENNAYLMATETWNMASLN